MRILPLSTIDDNRTILQEVLRIRKYLEVNPIRNIFYINEDYEVGVVSYDVTKIYTNSELDVEASADDILLFKNGYIGVIDSIGAEYVTVIGAQPIRGAKGDTGATGNGIVSIEKTGTSGLVDTYTITFTNGSTTVFTVTNGANGQDGQDGATGATGNGIASIEKSGTSGLIDTYTITFTNGTTATFTVTNGANGQNGVGVPAGGTDGQVLTKDGATDYSTKWADPSSGGGGGVTVIGENLIINPNFGINQRSYTTSKTTVSTATYTRDRWYATAGSIIELDGLPSMKIYSGSLDQFIDKNPHSNYIVVGITIIGDSALTPTVSLGYYENDTFHALTPVNSSPIVKNVVNNVSSFNRKQIINIYENPKEETLQMYRFSIGVTAGESTEYAGIMNAFMYCIDSYSAGLLDDTIFSVIVNSNLEIEKCKYYFEYKRIISQLTSNTYYSGTNVMHPTISECCFKRVYPTKLNESMIYVDKPQPNASSGGVTITTSFSEYDQNQKSKTAYIKMVGTSTSQLSQGYIRYVYGNIDLDSEIYP